jgi:TfoX/Sxy family transcriptional regulator of competence genes
MKNSFEKIIQYYQGKAGIEKGRMFGSVGLKAAGKVFAMEVKGRLVVKLPADRVGQISNAGDARLFDPGHGRKMKEWVEVEAASKLDWLALAKESASFVKAGAKK